VTYPIGLHTRALFKNSRVVKLIASFFTDKMYFEEHVNVILTVSNVSIYLLVESMKTYLLKLYLVVHDNVKQCRENIFTWLRYGMPVCSTRRFKSSNLWFLNRTATSTRLIIV